MERRRFLASTGAVTAVAASSFPSPAIAQGVRELKLVTTWPKGLPGLQTGAERVAQSITALSGGRLQVTVFAAGELVGAFESFDAVAAGVADMYHGAEYCWQAQSPAFSFFSAVPLGLTATETNAWIYWGGGQELWDELSAEFDAVLLALREASAEVMAEIGQSDPMTQRVYDSYHKFRDNAIRWTDLSERAYLNARS